MNKTNYENNIYFLKDLDEGCIDAVVIAKTSTKEQIQDAIYKARQTEHYTWDNILDHLPEDCQVYDKWNFETIYY